MNTPRYRDPDEFLCAYHQSRCETVPGPDAFHWLRHLVVHRLKLEPASYRHAESILDRSVIDVEDVVDNFLGFDLFLNDLREFDRVAQAPVFGHTRPLSRTVTVCFRAQAYRPLYRTTVMHEVAHLMLHTEGNAPFQYAPASKKRPQIEREADQYMALALLPEPILYLAIVLAAHERDAAPTDAFQYANTKRGRWQWRYIYFPYFLNRLCLSRELVAVRMVNRGTFTQETFEYHKTYPIPNRWRQPSPLFMGRLANDAFDAFFTQMWISTPSRRSIFALP